MGVSIKDIAAPSSGDSWSPQPGDTVVGDVTFVRMMAPKRNTFNNQMEQEIRIDLLTDAGSTVTIWAVTNTDTEGDGYPSRLARAIATGVRNGGADEIEVGGRLACGRIADVPPSQPGRQPAKDYVAEYRPPSTGVTMTGLLGASEPTPPPTAPPVQMAGGLLGTSVAPVQANPFAGLMGEPVAPTPPVGLIQPKVQPQHLNSLAAAFGATPDAVAEWPPVQMARAMMAKGLDGPTILQMLTHAYGMDGGHAAEWLAEAEQTTPQPAPPPANPLANLLGGAR